MVTFQAILKLLKSFLFQNVKILDSSIITVPFHYSVFSKVLENVLYDRLYDYTCWNLKLFIHTSLDFRKINLHGCNFPNGQTRQNFGKWGGRNWNIHWFSQSIGYSGPYYSTGKITLSSHHRHCTQLALQEFNGKIAVRWIRPNYLKFTSTTLKLKCTTFSFIYKWPCPCPIQPFCHIVLRMTIYFTLARIRLHWLILWIPNSPLLCDGLM